MITREPTPLRRGPRRRSRRHLSLLRWGMAWYLGILMVLIARGALTPGGTERVYVIGALGLGLVIAVAQVVLAAVSPEKLRRPRPVPQAAVLEPGRLSQRHLDHMVSLLNVSRAVGANTSGVDLDQVIVDSCRDCFDCDEASIMMVRPGRDHLQVTAFSGHRNANAVRAAKVEMGKGVAGTVAMHRRPMILGANIDRDRFPGFEAKQRRINSAMIAPIVVRNEVVGVLSASTGNPALVYDDDDLRVFCILAEHAGIVAAKAGDTERVIRILRRLRRRSRARALKLAEASPSGSGGAAAADAVDTRRAA